MWLAVPQHHPEASARAVPLHNLKGKKLLMEFVENAKQKNCVPQTGYIQSMGLKAE
jgi:hypothetical protein